MSITEVTLYLFVQICWCKTLLCMYKPAPECQHAREAIVLSGPCLHSSVHSISQIMWTKTPGSMKAAPTYVRLFCIYVISSTYSIYFFLYKINLVLYLPVHLYLYTMYVLNKGAFSYHWLCKVWSFTLYDVNRKKVEVKHVII